MTQEMANGASRMFMRSLSGASVDEVKVICKQSVEPSWASHASNAYNLTAFSQTRNMFYATQTIPSVLARKSSFHVHF